jgi:hypothetical protein
MAVVARFDDPLAVFATDNFSDVVRPHDDGADPRSPRPSPMSPVAREIVTRARIGPDQTPHLPTAPSGGTPPVAATVCDSEFASARRVSARGNVMVVMLAMVMLPRVRALNRNHHSNGCDP